ncbi:MAG: hypothetical protein C0407_14860 [Desulfobacca sp.]|nr:hypothetical protein [Desulfobacca sp.]
MKKLESLLLARKFESFSKRDAIIIGAFIIIQPFSRPPHHRQPTAGLSLLALIALTFFSVSGGAFGLENAVRAAGPRLVLLGIILLPWLWSFPIALMTAELSTAIPENGGYVVWVEKAFGRFWGFQEGWWSWMCSLADNALYPVLFLDYLTYLRGDMPSLERWSIGLILILIVAFLNIRGIHLVGFFSILFMSFILAPFLLMIMLGALQIKPAHWLASQEKVNWAMLLNILLWNTSGWDNIGCCAEEIEKPGKNYPRALAFTVGLVTLLYLLPIAVGVSADTNWSLWRVGFFPKIAAQIGGPWLGLWMTLAGLISAAGMFNALLCTSSRIPYALAKRGMLPGPLAQIHPAYGTPRYAIIINILGVAALIPFSFQELIELDMFLYAAALFLEFCALFRLRLKKPDMPRPYRIPVGMAGIVGISIPPVLLCLLSIGLSNKLTKVAGIVVLILGVLFYLWSNRRLSRYKIEY